MSLEDRQSSKSQPCDPKSPPHLKRLESGALNKAMENTCSQQQFELTRYMGSHRKCIIISSGDNISGIL